MKARPLAVALSLGIAVWLASGAATAQAVVPEGQWLIDGKAAVQLYDCGGLLCGRIAWLVFHNPPGQRFDHDKRNPNPALRPRPLCGLTILRGLKPDGDGRWRGGSFYSPSDGRTYRVSMQMKSADTIWARFFLGAPIFGKTKTLTRVPAGAAPGEC